MTIACPTCGAPVEIVEGHLEEHTEPPHVVETKKRKVIVHVRCVASGARVEVRR